MKSKIEQISKKDHQDKSAVIRSALQKYIFRRDIDELREKMIPRAQKMGIYTDEDVFSIVS
jgi:predicted transcriptional regulator